MGDLTQMLPPGLPKKPGEFWSWPEVLTTTHRHLLPGWPVGRPGYAVACNAVRLSAVIDIIRKAHGGPVHPTSWYRPPLLNEAVGGDAASYHLWGAGVDLDVPEDGPATECARSLLAAGALVECLHHDQHLHVAVKPLEVW